MRSESKRVGRPRDVSRGPHHRRQQIVYGDARQQEHMCWDPKGGELCLVQLKPGESRVKGFRDTDVQIVLVT